MKQVEPKISTTRKAAAVDELRRVGLIPVLRAPSPDDARALAVLLFEAGLPNIEITLTVPGALELIAELTARFGSKLLVGAGTVLDAWQAAACVAAGARFIVSPALDRETIRYCLEADVACLPGALTPTEIVAAWRAGADMVKVFPCGAMGGPRYISALKAPLPAVDLCPTGGVSLDTAGAFIRAGAAALGVGADLADVPAVREGRAHDVADRARRYLTAVRHARGAAHVDTAAP